MARTILLVDDERDCLEPLALVLKKQYNILTAEGGLTALEILESQPVDLIITDQRMPGMTGVDLLIQVRKKFPKIVRLLLTAYVDYKAMQRAFSEAQVYHFELKPWGLKEMREKIEQALEWKDQDRPNGRKREPEEPVAVPEDRRSTGELFKSAAEHFRRVGSSVKKRTRQARRLPDTLPSLKQLEEAT
jgi:response regulator RpfG family c-di-GMP phosphodiesterase